MSLSPSAVHAAASLIPEMLRTAVVFVFRTMARRDVTLLHHARASRPALELPASSGGPGSLVIATVAFHGGANGAVRLLLSPDLATELAGDILGLDPLEPANGGFETVKDAMVELTNVTAGSFKSQLCDLGFSCHLATPTVIHGAAPAPSPRFQDSSQWALAFETRGVRFAIEVFFEPVS